MPVLILHTIDFNLPMLYFICYFYLSLQSRKILLRWSDVKVAKGINRYPIIPWFMNKKLDLLGNALWCYTRFAIFEAVLLIIIIELKGNITFVSKFLMGFKGRISNRTVDQLSIGLIASIGEKVAELTWKWLHLNMIIIFLYSLSIWGYINRRTLNYIETNHQNYPSHVQFRTVELRLLYFSFYL